MGPTELSQRAVWDSGPDSECSSLSQTAPPGDASPWQPLQGLLSVEGQGWASLAAGIVSRLEAGLPDTRELPDGVAPARPPPGVLPGPRPTGPERVDRGWLPFSATKFE